LRNPLFRGLSLRDGSVIAVTGKRNPNMAKVRIQKLLSEAGVASRRAVEEMILESRITVNNEPVTALPCFVDPDEDHIRIDGKPVRRRPSEHVYFLLNKPRGTVCTQSDPQGRPLAMERVPEIPGTRVYCVGRLDVESTGLILLTNDGELTQYLTHPKYGVPKTYAVEVRGTVTPEQIAASRRGSYVRGRRSGGAAIKFVRQAGDHSLLEVTLSEGRSQDIHEALRALGIRIHRLRRVAIGPVTDRGLDIGAFRPLELFEVAKLRRCGKLPFGGEGRGKPAARKHRERGEKRKRGGT
jgi:pseudouridine synthase